MFDAGAHPSARCNQLRVVSGEGEKPSSQVEIDLNLAHLRSQTWEVLLRPQRTPDSQGVQYRVTRMVTHPDIRGFTIYDGDVDENVTSKYNFEQST